MCREGKEHSSRRAERVRKGFLEEATVKLRNDLEEGERSGGMVYTEGKASANVLWHGG